MLNKNNRMLRRLSTSKTISIELLEPIVFIGSNMSAPPVLRGTVTVVAPKQCNIHDLKLQFEGSLKTKWTKENKTFSALKTIAFSELLLHSAENAKLELSAGTTQFAFEMPLPAGLPETVHCSQINVDYHLIVSLNSKKKYTLGSSYEESTVMSVIVVRLPDAGIFSTENYEAIDSHKHFSKWFQYRITVDKKSLALGSDFPIKIEIAPVVKRLMIKQIVVQLLEFRAIFPDGETKTTSQLCHFLSPTKGQKFKLPSPPLMSTWEDVCIYHIPNKGKISHSTEKTYPGFHVDHTLLISFVIYVPRQGTRTISFQTEIDLLDSRVCGIHVSDRLPAYNFPFSHAEIYKLSQYGLVNLTQ